MKPDPDRQALIDQILEKLRQKLQAQLPDDTVTLDEIETIAGNLGEELAQDMQRRLTRKRTAKPRDNQIDCTCGARARYKGQQKRSSLTWHGLLVWKRAVYQCPRCQRRWAPL